MFSFRDLPPQKQYIVGQMALDGLSVPVIKFYIKVFDILKLDKPNIKQLALYTNYTSRTVTNYMRVLEKNNYVERLKCREWVISYPVLRDCVFEKAARRDEVHI